MPGSDAVMCSYIMEKYCGTTALKGYTTSTMHMFLSDCGGHAGYHDHVTLACEYTTTSGSTAHSALVGIMLDGRGLYGMYESGTTKPTNLDACNGHTGPVPAATGTLNQWSTTASSLATTTYSYAAATSVYHYHVTSSAPYFNGCFGPVDSLATANALYQTCGTASGTCTCSQNTAGTSSTGSLALGSTSSYYCCKSAMTDLATTTTGPLTWSGCTSAGMYTDYKLDCPIYSHCSSTGTCTTQSQLNTSCSGCAACTGNCPTGVTTVSTTCDATTTTTTTTTTTAASSSTSTTNAIIGGVVGGVGGLALIGAAIWYLHSQSAAAAAAVKAAPAAKAPALAINTPAASDPATA